MIVRKDGRLARCSARRRGARWSEGRILVNYVYDAVVNDNVSAGNFGTVDKDVPV